MRTDTQKGARIAEWYFLSLMKIPKKGMQERKIYDTLLAAGPTFTYSDYSSECFGSRSFHRALFNLKHRFKMEIEKAPERNVHGFKGYRLKQEQLALLQKKEPASLRAFLLPTAVSASAEAKGYARTAITITAAIVRPTITAAITAIVRPRSIAVASIIRAVVTIAIVAIVTPTRADVG